VFDIYWAGGCQRTAQVSAITATTITFASTYASGDNLPIATTAIVASQVVSLLPQNFSSAAFLGYQFTGPTDKCTVTALATVEGSIDDVDSETVDGGEVIARNIENGDSNVFDFLYSTVSDGYFIYVSNGSPTTDAHFDMIVSFDATPGSNS
jgi:hypothetical protein